MEILKSLWRLLLMLWEGFVKAFPIIVFIVGAGSFAYSIWGNISDSKWKEFFNGMGKMMVVGGVFTYLTKWLQFSGIIRQEITNFIFEPRFLANRKDLPEFWEKVTSELFKHKFQSINKRLMKDVKEKYLPIDHIMYYDDIEHLIEIGYDKDTGIAIVNQTVNLDAIPSKKTDTYSFNFGNTMIYQNDPSEVSYECKVKVNGKELVGKEFEVKKETDSKKKRVISTLKFDLTGYDKYVVERKEIKKYNIKHDNFITHTAKRIYNKMKIEIDYPKDLIEIELYKCGTLDNFVLEHENTHSVRYTNKGIIYPEQGYCINIKIK